MTIHRAPTPIPEQSIGAFLETVDPPTLAVMRHTAYVVFAAVDGDEEQCRLLLKMIVGPTSGYTTARFGGRACVGRRVPSPGRSRRRRRWCGRGPVRTATGCLSGAVLPVRCSRRTSVRRAVTTAHDSCSGAG